MKTNYLLSLLILLIFVSCSKTESPLSSSDNNESGLLYKNSGNGSKDIKGKLAYNYTTGFDLNCYTCDEGSFSGGNYLGTGELSHLGEVSSKTKACISFIFSGENIIGVHVDKQCASFVALNGDVLNLSNDPYDLYMNNQGLAVGTCKFYFEGGTGKYKNASGSFKGAVENNLQGYFTVDIKGTLSY